MLLPGSVLCMQVQSGRIVLPGDNRDGIPTTATSMCLPGPRVFFWDWNYLTAWVLNLDEGTISPLISKR